uniref:Uncharacterized protein n=1 Tax=Ascaris lumbricoides TaxID=6252 RepID=A0A0M3I490_ASCLU
MPFMQLRTIPTKKRIGKNLLRQLKKEHLQQKICVHNVDVLVTRRWTRRRSPIRVLSRWPNGFVLYSRLHIPKEYCT